MATTTKPKSYQKLLVKRKIYLHNYSSFQNKINEFNEFKINVFNPLYTSEYTDKHYGE